MEPGLIEKMTAEMSHRGPDGMHYWQQGSATFGHCMLHTTAESLEEVQPCLSDDGRHVLVMDGRLDNWEELRKRLELHEARLRNRSDSELVIQAFLLWGMDCLKYIEGDFAFIVWDRLEKKIHCVRDRMGGKPFHYHWNGKTLSFASELRALFLLPWVPKICNEDMLVDYLMAQWCTKNETLWKDIYRLPQAHRLEIDPAGFRIKQYWQPDLETLLDFDSDEEYIECYRSLFIEAVRRSSRSHQEVAFEVSGGLDSSALFAVADHLQKDARFPAPGMNGYTLDFHDDKEANELEYAAAVAMHLGRPVHEIAPTKPSLEWHRKWARDYGEMPPYPNGGLSIGIREQARKNGSRAVVVGVGGDEWLIAGRSYYAEEIQARRWQALALCWRADMRDYGTAKPLWWLARYGALPLLPSGLKKAVRATFSRRHPFGETDMSWLSHSMQDRVRNRRVNLHTAMPGKFRQISQVSKWHMTFSATNAEARESEERMAAHYGLEIRWPFFNLQLAQFAFSSPDRIRLRGSTHKFVHRQAMHGLLPPVVAERTTKADFMITFRRYLKEMEAVYCNEIASKREDWVVPDKLRDLFRITQSGPTPNGMPEWQLWGVFCCDAICV